MHRAFFRTVSLTLFLVCTGLFVDSTQGDAVTAETALIAYQAAVGSIESYDVRCVVNSEWQLETVATATRKTGGKEAPVLEWQAWAPNASRKKITRYYRQVKLADGHRRIDETDSKTGKLVSASVFDGNVYKQYSPISATGMVSGHPAGFVHDGDDYSAYIENAYGTYPYMSLFRSRQNTRLQSENREPHTVVLESPPGEGAGWDNTGWRLWLDSKRGFMPARIERYLNSPDVLFDREEVTKFHQLPSGVWVPVNVRVTFFVTGKSQPLFGQPAIVTNMDVDVANSHWNESVSPETFELGFPAGTRVADLTRKVAFTTGASDPGKNIDDLVRGAKNVIAINTGSEHVGLSFWRVLMLALNAGVIALLLVLVIIRRRRRTVA